jgi:hypothetical protein
MKMFFRNIRWAYYDLINGFRNLWRWFLVIWNDRDFDHYYIEVLLYHKLRNTLEFFESKDSVTDWEHEDTAKALKALRICVTILERRREEFYIAMCSDLDNYRLVENIMKCEERDMMVFGKLFGKYLPYWWD